MGIRHTIINRFVAILAWLVNLFDPPPLASMTRAQKLGRIFFFTLTLLVGCILMAMVGASGIFVMEKGREMLGNIPELWSGLEIIFASVCVNVVCVIILFEIKKADRKLILSSKTLTGPGMGARP